MFRRRFAPLIPAIWIACAPADTAPGRASEIAEGQAALATDSSQARLWREAINEGAAAPLAEAHTDEPVAGGARLVVTDRPGRASQEAFPASVDAALVLAEAPDLDEPYAGTARVQSASGEFLTLDLDGAGTLSIHSRVGGRALRAAEGEVAEVLFRRGTPFARDDVLGVRLERDDLVYALVGADEPVRFDITSHAIRVAQVGEPEGNVLSVSLTVGRETQTLNIGDQVDFRAGLTVKLLASVAVQGQAANALPGRPYRVELLGWRTAGEG